MSQKDRKVDTMHLITNTDLPLFRQQQSAIKRWVEDLRFAHCFGESTLQVSETKAEFLTCASSSCPAKHPSELIEMRGLARCGGAL